MLEFLSLRPDTFGLDINDSSFKIIKLRKKHGFLQPVSFNEKGIAPGIVKDGIIKDEKAFIENLKEIMDTVRGEKLGTKYVVASLPEEKSFSQVIQMPKMDEKELMSAVGFEAENYIPLPSEKMYLDFKKIDPIVDHLDHLDVLIVAVEKTIVDSYVSCLKKSGLIPVTLEIETQSIVRTLVKDETSLTPIVLIDFGGDSTDFIVFSGHSIRFTSSISVSSQQVTEAISKELGITERQAEHMKIKYGLSSKKPAHRSKAVLKTIGPVLSELINEIQKYLEFYSGHDFHDHIPQKLGKKNNVEKIILSGGGANLKGLDEFLSKKLGIPVEFGDPWINFSDKFKKNIPFELQKKSLSYVTALGLALRKTDSEFYQ
jgi:type IV pilus assembly protein PilM